MERRLKDTLRAGATAVGVATGLLALASTAQTPDGYIHASFGGPLDVLSKISGTTNTSTDVLAIGDGTNDATELAALLKGPIGPAAQQGAPNSPYRVAYEAGAAPNPMTGSDPMTGSLFGPALGAIPTFAAPTRKDAGILPSKPVVDSQGRIDCSGAVSCRTDPATNITTVTYADGVVAIVQKINDLTVVAYQTLTKALPAEISSLLPQVPTAPPPLLAAVAPPVSPPITPTAPVVASTPTVTAPAPESSSASIDAGPASIDPGPPAPNAGLDSTGNGPKINVTTPPKDFGTGTDIGTDTGTTGTGTTGTGTTGTGTTGTGTTGIGTDATPPKAPSLSGKVKDTIGGVVDSVKDAVGSALGPGASVPESSGGSNSSTSDSSKNSTSDSNSDRSKSDNSSGS